MGLAELVLEGAEQPKIAQYLDGLSHPERLAQMYQLKPAMQAKLYDICDGVKCTLADDFVPSAVADNTEVTHWGINSLPVFRKFQKPMARIQANDGPKIVGFNRQTMAPITGPGYFTSKDQELDGKQRVVIDYLDVPFDADGVMPGWPKVLPQNAKLSRFIYYQTRDWMWKVSEHITIGRAKKLDNWLDNWFVLCRQGD